MDTTAQRETEEALRQTILQEEIIRAQRATLEELSTPLLGAVDTRRAQQVLETLLEGIARTQVETAILDITGVSVVDTQLANALIRDLEVDMRGLYNVLELRKAFGGFEQAQDLRQPSTPGGGLYDLSYYRDALKLVRHSR